MADNLARLMVSFRVMGLGMLGIFVVMVALYLATLILTRMKKG